MVSLRGAAALRCSVALALATASLTTDLGGRHLDITSVHDGDGKYTNMLKADGTFEPDSSLWTGFFPDMIARVSELARFNYTLHSATGLGTRCGNGTGPIAHMSAYNCAQDDVSELGKTEVYWAMFYETPGRSAVSRFTGSFMSDVGLSMLVAPVQENFFEKATKIFTPFTRNFWICSLATALLVALCNWVVESSVNDGENTPSQAGVNGYLTAVAARYHGPRSVSESLLVLFNMSILNTKTGKGDLLNVVWCLFAVIWLAAYTANLAQVMVTDVQRYGATSLEALSDSGGKACVKRGAAYAAFLEILYPDIGIVPFEASDLDDVVKKLRNGDCDAYVDVEASLEIVRGLPRFCKYGLEMPSEPIASGYQDMAVGVREDLVDVRDALSFWVNQLRACSPVVPDPACYGRWNMDELWKHWAPYSCDTDAGGDDGDGQLGIDAFALPLFAILATCAAVVVAELSSDRARHRFRTLFSRHSALLDFLRSQRHWWHDLETSKFLMDLFVKDLREGLVLDAVRGPLLDYYLLTDTTAWTCLKKADAHLTGLLSKMGDGDDDGPRENFDRVREAAMDNVVEYAKRAVHDILIAHKLKVARDHVNKKNNILPALSSHSRSSSSLSSRALSSLPVLGQRSSGTAATSARAPASTKPTRIAPTAA